METLNLTFSPRRKWLAAAMSFAYPGLGQLYNGRPKKAVVFGGLQLLALPTMYLLSSHLPTRWMVPSILTIVFLAAILPFWSAVEAGRSAKRLTSYVMRGLNRWYIYIAFIAVQFFLMNAVAVNGRAHILEPYLSPSGSMLPTIMAGDRFYVDKRWNCSGCVKNIRRGQVVIFRAPQDREHTVYVKRVIGLAGDTVKTVGGKIEVNGRALSQNPTGSRTAIGHGAQEGVNYLESNGDLSYEVILSETPHTGEGAIPNVDLLVPEGTVFVMGDNRDNSFDSRQFGPVPVADVIGYPKQIWLSYDFDQGFRLNRIGKVLEP